MQCCLALVVKACWTPWVFLPGNLLTCWLQTPLTPVGAVCSPGLYSLPEAQDVRNNCKVQHPSIIYKYWGYHKVNLFTLSSIRNFHVFVPARCDTGEGSLCSFLFSLCSLIFADQLSRYSTFWPVSTGIGNRNFFRQRWSWRTLGPYADNYSCSRRVMWGCTKREATYRWSDSNSKGSSCQ